MILIILTLYIVFYPRILIMKMSATLILMILFFTLGNFFNFKSIKYILLNIAIIIILLISEIILYPSFTFKVLSEKINVTDKISLPVFELTDLNGKSIKNENFIGKVIMLDFWSVTCGYCIKQLPSLEPIANHFKDNKNVVFFIVNIGTKYDTKENIENLMNKRNIKIPVLIDRNSEFSTKMNCLSVPQMFLIDRNTNIRFHYYGYQNDEIFFQGQIINQINTLLNE